MSWLIEKTSRVSAPVDCSCSWKAPTPKSDSTLKPALAYKGQVLWTKAERLSRARNCMNVYWMGRAPSRVSRRVQGPPCQGKVLRTLSCILRLDSTHLVQESETSALLNSMSYWEVPMSHIWPVDSSLLIESFDHPEGAHFWGCHMSAWTHPPSIQLNHMHSSEYKEEELINNLLGLSNSFLYV